MASLDSTVDIGVGSSVWHSSHGKGEIVSIDDGLATVSFDGSSQLGEQIARSLTFRRLIDEDLSELEESLGERSSTILKAKVPVDLLHSGSGAWKVERKSMTIDELCGRVLNFPFTLDSSLISKASYGSGFPQARKAMESRDPYDPDSVIAMLVETIDAMSGVFITRTLEKAPRLRAAQEYAQSMHDAISHPKIEDGTWSRLALDRSISSSFGSVPEEIMLWSLNVVSDLTDLEDAVHLARALNSTAVERFRRWLMLDLESIKESLDNTSSGDWPELRRRLTTARKGT